MAKKLPFLQRIPLVNKGKDLPPIKRMFSYFLGNLPWWQIFLIFAGFIAVIGLILSLFVSFGDHTKYRWTTEVHPVDSEEFLQAIARTATVPVEYGDDIKIYNNGDEFLPALLDAIKNAQQSINFTAYIWEKGSMSDQVFGALIERQRAGVEVRVLLDGFGGHGAPKEQIDELKRAGGQVEEFRNPEFGKFTRIHKRDHRRAIVIDGKIGFTGGMAVADHWLGDARSTDEWRDMMFEVHGTMAQSLQGSFAQLWAGTRGEILEGQKFYPTLENAQNQNQPSRFVAVSSSPASDTQPLTKFFWLSIASAKQKVYVNSSYFVPDKYIREALMERARAGLDVRLLVPNNNTDAKPIRLASHYYFQDLLEAGVKIYEYQPTMIHSKFMVIDDTWSVIGSANMDIRSVQLNEENVMGVSNKKFAQDLTNVFLENLQKAQEIQLDAWKKRGIFVRLGEAIFVNFVKQY